MLHALCVNWHTPLISQWGVQQVRHENTWVLVHRCMSLPSLKSWHCPIMTCHGRVDLQRTSPSKLKKIQFSSWGLQPLTYGLDHWTCWGYHLYTTFCWMVLPQMDFTPLMLWCQGFKSQLFYTPNKQGEEIKLVATIRLFVCNVFLLEPINVIPIYEHGGSSMIISPHLFPGPINHPRPDIHSTNVVNHMYDNVVNHMNDVSSLIWDICQCSGIWLINLTVF